MEDTPIVVVGLMGAGKSATGRAVARRLERPFLDADDELERRAGRSVTEVFAALGEDGFRSLEAEVLDDVLARRPPVVLATGGGVVVRPANRRALRERARVVWLQAPVAELARRVGSGAGRPLLAADPIGTLTALEAQRAPWYAEVADHRVDTGGRSVDQVADEVLRALGAVGVGEGR